MKKLRILISLTMVFFMVLAVGCTGQEDEDPASNGQAEEQVTESSEELEDGVAAEDDSLLLEGDFKVADAVAKFKDKSDGASLTKVQLSKYNDKTYYEIEGCKEDSEIEIRFNINTGKIIKKDVETDDCDTDDIFKFEQAKPVADAYEVAESNIPLGYQLKDWSLSKDDGNLVYEFKFINENKDDLDVVVNAESLKLIGIDD